MSIMNIITLVLVCGLLIYALSDVDTKAYVIVQNHKLDNMGDISVRWKLKNGIPQQGSIIDLRYKGRTIKCVVKSLCYSQFENTINIYVDQI